MRFLRNLNFTENTRTERSNNVLKIKNITIHFRNGSRLESDIWKCGCCPVETKAIGLLRYSSGKSRTHDDITRFVNIFKSAMRIADGDSLMSREI